MFYKSHTYRKYWMAQSNIFLREFYDTTTSHVYERKRKPDRELTRKCAGVDVRITIE